MLHTFSKTSIIMNHIVGLSIAYRTFGCTFLSVINFLIVKEIQKKRYSRLQMFLKIGVLKSFANFTGLKFSISYDKQELKKQDMFL